MNLRKCIIVFTLVFSFILFSGCIIDKSKSGVQNISPTLSATDHEADNLIPSPSVTPTFTPLVTPTATPAPIAAAESRARDLMQGMTLDEKVGQLFFVRLRKSEALEDIHKYHLGGYILFSDDFRDENKSTIKELLASYQSASRIPLLIGVDEEGGTVNRVSRYPSFRVAPFRSPKDVYADGGFGLVKSDTLEKAKLLLSLGINVNLAPVCDVSTDSSAFIYDRSFGKDAVSTSEYIRTVVDVMKQQKLGCTLKHFPGYGNNVDTHTDVAIDERDYDTFVNSDFLPFKAGIDAGAGSILVSHNIVTNMDKDYPASLSKDVHLILRNDLGFTGVIMTDDLDMGAIKKFTNDVNAAVLAIKAGNDLIIATNFTEQIPDVIDAVKNGIIPMDRIDESVFRILMWKLSLGVVKGTH